MSSGVVSRFASVCSLVVVVVARPPFCLCPPSPPPVPPTSDRARSCYRCVRALSPLRCLLERAVETRRFFNWIHGSARNNLNVLTASSKFHCRLRAACFSSRSRMHKHIAELMLCEWFAPFVSLFIACHTSGAAAPSRFF